jgi:hypothetical protein
VCFGKTSVKASDDFFSQGILSGDLDRVKTQFLQTFGFEQLMTWDRLKQVTILQCL